MLHLHISEWCHLSYTYRHEYGVHSTLIGSQSRISSIGAQVYGIVVDSHLQGNIIGGMTYGPLWPMVYMSFTYRFTDMYAQSIGRIIGLHPQEELGKSIRSEVIQVGLCLPAEYRHGALPGLHQGIMTETGVLCGGRHYLSGLSIPAGTLLAVIFPFPVPHLHGPPVPMSCLQRRTSIEDSHRLIRHSPTTVPHIGTPFPQSVHRGGHQYAIGHLHGTLWQFPSQGRPTGANVSCLPIVRSGYALQHVCGKATGRFAHPCTDFSAHINPHNQCRTRPYPQTHVKISLGPRLGTGRFSAHSKSDSK